MPWLSRLLPLLMCCWSCMEALSKRLQVSLNTAFPSCPQSNTQEDRGGSVLEAVSGDEQNEADAGGEMQDDDQPSHSPATGRSVLWQSAAAERSCRYCKQRLKICVVCLLKPEALKTILQV